MPAIFFLLAVFAAALAFDFVNGFHDAPNVTAALIGTKTLNRRQAIAWNVLWTALPAYFVSTAVAKTVGAGLLAATALTLPVLTVGLTAAVGWGLFTWWKGIPSSSTYALLGGLLGATGINSMLNCGSFDPATMAKAFFDPVITSAWLDVLKWMITAPFVGFVLAKSAALIIAKRPLRFIHAWKLPRNNFLTSINKIIKRSFAVADMPLASIENTTKFFIRSGTQPKHFKETVHFPGTVQAYSLLCTSAFFSLAHAGNDAMKTAGILTLALNIGATSTGFIVPPWIIGLSFATMAVGTALGGGRIESTLINKLGNMTPTRGALGQLVAAVTVATASHFGIPLSSTLAYTASNAGANEKTEHQIKMVRTICARWIYTIPATAALAAVLMLLAATTARIF